MLPQLPPIKAEVWPRRKRGEVRKKNEKNRGRRRYLEPKLWRKKKP
jgi:hypothetical protein